MNTIELTDDELAFIKACISFVKDGNIGFEAIDEWSEELIGLDLWGIADDLEGKL